MGAPSLRQTEPQREAAGGRGQREGECQLDPREAAQVDAYLGPAKFRKEVAFRVSRPGVATGVSSPVHAFA